MSKKLSTIFLVAIIIDIQGCTSSSQVSDGPIVRPVYDDVNLLRNPAMGWGLYDDASGEVQNAEVYWKAQDTAARKYASFFYVRWRWSDMEPEEGKYAWHYDDNYKKLIKGALDRRLKLCFRVYDNGQDNIRPGTPLFVKNAGAKGYKVKWGNVEHWTPYPDDEIFKKKWTNFIKAFAKEYDDPTIVDFVDGYSIGAWGEAHTIKLKNQAKLHDVLDWITTSYSQSFKRVLLLLPMNSQVGFEAEKDIAIAKNAFNYRRDGLGSMWFTPQEKQMAKNMFGKVLLVGESCYWGCEVNKESCKPYAVDKTYPFKSWKDVYRQTYKDAIEYHFNTLDLREVPETRGWINTVPNLVTDFMVKGGYRFYPSEIQFPNKVFANKPLKIEHTWVNYGNGYLPNNNLKWNFKYKPAFAIFDDKGKQIKIFIAHHAEPSTWLEQGKGYKYTLTFDAPDIPKGEYLWAVAIIDTSNGNQPGIKLAIKDGKLIDDWQVLSTFKIL